MNASEVDVIIMQLMSSGVGFDVHIKLWSLLLLQKLWCFFSFLHYKTLKRPSVFISSFTTHILQLKSNFKSLKWKITLIYVVFTPYLFILLHYVKFYGISRILKHVWDCCTRYMNASKLLGFITSSKVFVNFFSANSSTT